MLASILLSACMVPERLHLTMIGAGTGSGAAIAQRLETESFDSVAKSISPDSADVAFYEIGWLTRGQLQAQKHAPIMLLLGAAGRADIDAALSLRVGGTAEVHDGSTRKFVHLEEIRAKMTCDRALARYPDDQGTLITHAAWYGFP